MKRLYIIALFVFASGFASAQENGNRDAQNRIVRGPYETNRFFDNIFVGVAGGVNLYFGENDSEGKFGKRLAPAMDIHVGKWFTPSIGARVGYAGLQAKGWTSAGTLYAKSADGGLFREKFGVMYLHADAMWNFSNAVSGYKESRTWNFVPFVGVGWARSYGNDAHDNEIGFDAGLLNVVRLCSSLDLTLEELIAMRQQKGYEGLFTLRVPFLIDSCASAAAVAALRPGDEIVGIDDLQGLDYPAYRTYLGTRGGDSVRLDVLRGGERMSMVLPVSEEGKIGVIARNPYSYRTRNYTFAEAIPAGIRKTGDVLASYWEQLKLIVQPKTKMYEELGGFISIGSIFPSQWDWQDFWMKTAFLSIILAVMNILPIPGLDGGHAIFTFWEMISGRKVSDKVLEAAQYVGLIIILFLLLYANGNDIYRFFIK